MQAHFLHIDHEYQPHDHQPRDIEAAVPLVNDANHSETAPTGCHIDKHTLLYAALWFAPVISATNLGAQALVGLTTTGKSFAQAVPLSLFDFINSLAMGGKVTVENMQDTIQAIQKGELPEDLIDKNMSSKKRKALIFLGLAITLYVSAGDGILSKFFVSQVPEDLHFDNQINKTGWNAFAIFLASATSVSIAFSEGLETVAALQELFGDKGIEYHNNMSKWLSRTIGGLGGIFGSGEDILASFIGMQTVFNIATNSWWLLPTAVGGCLNGVADFSLNGRFNMKNINSVYTVMSTRYPSLKEAIIFILSAGVGTVAAYTTNSLITSFFGDVREMYQIDNQYYNYTATVFSYGSPANDFMIYTGAAFPLAYFAVDKISNSISSLINYCCPTKNNHPDNREKQRLLINEAMEKVALSRHTLLKEQESEKNDAPVDLNIQDSIFIDMSLESHIDNIPSLVIPSDSTCEKETSTEDGFSYKDLEKHGGLFQEKQVFTPFKEEAKKQPSHKQGMPLLIAAKQI